MALIFEPIRLDRKKEYAARLGACPQVASDYSLVNLFGWAEEYGLEWAFDQELVWIRQTRPQPLCWAPVGNWEAIDWRSRLAACMAPGTVITRIPAALALHLRRIGKTLEPARDHWDYLYRVEDLVALAGNRFHKKKNLVSQFKRQYAFTYLPFGPELVAQALAMQQSWCTWRDCEANDTLAAENRVIARVLDHWEALGTLIGGAITIEGRMIAYTLAEALGPDMLVIHFEKADQQVKGAYQAINQMFLADQGQGFATANREQDLGDEGLRKAKLSYHPVGYIEKFSMTV